MTEEEEMLRNQLEDEANFVRRLNYEARLLKYNNVPEPYSLEELLRIVEEKNDRCRN